MRYVLMGRNKNRKFNAEDAENAEKKRRVGKSYKGAQRLNASRLQDGVSLPRVRIGLSSPNREAISLSALCVHLDKLSAGPAF
jgi:hypothetical protein